MGQAAGPSRLTGFPLLWVLEASLLLPLITHSLSFMRSLEPQQEDECVCMSVEGYVQECVYECACVRGCIGVCVSLNMGMF